MNDQSPEEWVSQLLGSLPAPEMPAAVTDRIQAALAAEADQPHDELAARRARMRTSTRWLGVAAAVIAIAAGISIPAISGHDKSHSSSGADRSSLSAVAPETNALTFGAAVAPLTPSTIGDAVRALAATRSAQKAAAGTSELSGGTGAGSGSTGSSGAADMGAPAQDGAHVSAPAPAYAPVAPTVPDQSCLDLLTGAGSLVGYESETWNDQPAYLVVIDDPARPSTYTAYVVGTDCTAQRPHQLYQDYVLRS